jgi:hypothetical protein
MSADMIAGEDAFSHGMSVHTKVSASISSYCPDFTGTITLFLNDEKQQSWEVNKNDMSRFTEAGATLERSADISFDEGNWCTEFSITPVSSKAGSSPETKTSTRVCGPVEAKQCEIVPKTTFTGSLDSANFMMTYTANAAYSMNTWCATQNLTYSYNFEYMDE